MTAAFLPGVFLLNLVLAGCAGSSAGTSGVGDAGKKETAGASAKALAKETPKPESTAESARKPNEVHIDNFTFNPPQLTVKAGTRVTWINQDDVPHTATSSAKPRLFNSGTLDTDAKFSHVFKTPGTYDYFCAVHPHMTGRIIVK
jgi:plastocyanin